MATHGPDIERSIPIGVEDDGRRLPSDEFAEGEFAEPWVYERVAGRLEVMSPEGAGHVRQTEPWRDRLGAYALGRPDLVQMVVSQSWVRIDAETDRIGDIGVYLHGKTDELDIPDQVPDLICEVVSRSGRDRRRDYVEKRADYARAGVREYVIIDRFDRKVTVLSLADGVYEERVLEISGLYESPLLPGFAVRLAEVIGR